ncbi:MAG: PfkB family carbohydrate kinase, partial [Pseudomonadota bacterium]
MSVELITPQRFSEITSRFATLPPIAVVGDIGVDKYTIGEVKRISPEAPVPVLEVTEEKFKLGLAANVSNNLQALGIKSTLFGVVGDDHHADLLIKLLQQQKLSTQGIVKAKNRPTILKERVSSGQQQICRIDYEKQIDIDGPAQTNLCQQIKKHLPLHKALIVED